MIKGDVRQQIFVCANLPAVSLWHELFVDAEANTLQIRNRVDIETKNSFELAMRLISGDEKKKSNFFKENSIPIF